MIWLECEKACEERNQYTCRADGARAMDLLRKEGEPGSMLYVIECGNCGHITDILEEEWNDAGKEMERRACRRRVSLTRYPRIEPHTGLEVKSREHEAEVVKHAGYHTAEHGLDERHNDELADKLKSQRQAREDRRKAIRKKRETMIREGVIKMPKPKKRA